MESIKQALTLEAGNIISNARGHEIRIVGELSDGRFLVECMNNMPRNKDQILFLNCDGSTNGNDAWQFKPEPKRIKGWLNVYDENAHHPYLAAIVMMGQTVKISTCAKESRQQADCAASYFPEFNRIACIEIDVLEGAGLGEVA